MLACTRPSTIRRGLLFSAFILRAWLSDCGGSTGDLRGSPVVCPETAPRPRYAQAATALDSPVWHDRPAPANCAVWALFGSQTPFLCRFSRGTLLGTA
jgi:hypothetical protein